jgi:hypothetical protein
MKTLKQEIQKLESKKTWVRDELSKFVESQKGLYPVTESITD